MWKVVCFACINILLFGSCFEVNVEGSMVAEDIVKKGKINGKRALKIILAESHKPDKNVANHLANNLDPFLLTLSYIGV